MVGMSKTKNMTVELCFGNFESITLKLNARQSRIARKWLDKFIDPHVFFPDYEG